MTPCSGPTARHDSSQPTTAPNFFHPSFENLTKSAVRMYKIDDLRFCQCGRVTLIGPPVLQALFCSCRLSCKTELEGQAKGVFCNFLRKACFIRILCSVQSSRRRRSIGVCAESAQTQSEWRVQGTSICIMQSKGNFIEPTSSLATPSPTVHPLPSLI